MTDITPERARELLKVWRTDELHADTIRVIAEAFLEAERKLAAVEKAIRDDYHVPTGLSYAVVRASVLRAALGGDHERGPDEADALTTLALADDHEQPDCRCEPCPGRGNDGHGHTHCAECCFGTGLVADIDCPIHGDHEQPAQGSMDRLAAGKAQRQRFNLGDHDQPEHDNDCSSGAGFVDPYCTVCTPGPIRGDHEQPKPEPAPWRDMIFGPDEDSDEQPKPERTAEVDAAMRDFMGRMFGGPMSGGPHG